MSGSSNITNTNGSGNSWTILTPEAPAAGNVDPGIEGNESLTAPHSLTEEVTGSSAEMEAGDGTTYTEGVHSGQALQDPVVENIGPDAEGNEDFTDTHSLAEEVTGSGTESETGGSTVPTGGVRSEEGLQVCQETVAESNPGSTPPSPTLLSPCPSSHISLSSNLEGYTSVNREPDVFSDTYTHIASPESHTPVSPYPESVVSFPNPPSQGMEGLPQAEGSELAKKVTEVGKQADSTHDSELGAEQGTEGQGLRKRKGVPLGPIDQLGREGDEADEEGQLRPREGEEDGGGITLNKCILGALLLLGMGTILFSAEDVDVRELSDTQLHGNQEGLNLDADPVRVHEMAELLDKLAKENQKISELQTRLQSQEEELNTALQLAEEKGRESARKGELEKENEKMKEELSSLPALQSELESLRARVTELTLLTVKEESQQPPVSPSVSPPSDQSENGTQSLVVEETPEAKEVKMDAGGLKEELERQKVLLEGSRKRLEGMKAEGSERKGVREGLVEMERRLTEEVEKLGRRGGERRKRPWEGGGEREEQRKEWNGEKEGKRGRNGGKDQGRGWKAKELRKEWRGEKDWKEGGERGRDGGKEWREREERKEWRGEKEWKKGRNGGRSEGKEWKEKEEGKEWRGEKHWKQGRDGERGQGKEWKEREERRQWEEKEKEKEWHRDGEGKIDDWKEERKDGDWKKHNKYDNHKSENKNGDEGLGAQKEKGKKGRHWQGTPDKTPLKPSHRHHEHNDYWKRKRVKLQHFYRPLVECNGIAECAKMQGLAPVKLADFEALLGGYLAKLEEAKVDGREEISKLVKEFFVDEVFTHDKISFKDFVEDVADILEDMVEGEGEDNDKVEDEMEEFEKEALRKFSVTGGVDKESEGVKV